MNLHVLVWFTLVWVANAARLNKFSNPLSLDAGSSSRYLPIVMWHGMGDSADNPNSLGAVISYIKQRAPGIHIHSIATGYNSETDILSSFFGSVNSQIDRVCDDLARAPELQQGYVAVGFSQGGQFLRGVVQRCQQHNSPTAAVHTLVTMGSQHQGIMDIPGCWQPSFNASTSSWACRAMQALLGWSVYHPFVQSRSVQAQYFKDPDEIELYYRSSAFLADINAEAHPDEGDGDGILSLKRKYLRYKENLVSLKRLVLFIFDNDITVVPKESAHFGYFDGEKLVPLNESDLFDDDDRLGLRAMNENGQLVFDHCPGFHMQFTLEWFWERVVERYLLVERDGGSSSL